jgi:hypothetical protein
MGFLAYSAARNRIETSSDIALNFANVNDPYHLKIAPSQGTLTEGEGSVRLNSSLQWLSL